MRTLFLLGLLTAWDAAGFDLPLARLFGDAGGFALRADPLLFMVLHEGGRYLGWVLLAALFVAIRWPVGVLRKISVRDRIWLAFTVLGSLAAVSLMKGTSTTSCPWELHEFGGRLNYVSHWLRRVSDDGPGHCFPAGHASAAFAWVAGWFALRQVDARSARIWLVAALAMGFVFGLAQQARGAHFMSHTLWTAWICWAVAAGSYALKNALAGWRAPASAVESKVAGHA